MLSYCFIIYLQTARKLEANERTRSAELIPLGVGRYTVHIVLSHQQKPTDNMVEPVYRPRPSLVSVSARSTIAALPCRSFLSLTSTSAVLPDEPLIYAMLESPREPSAPGEAAVDGEAGTVTEVEHVEVMFLRLVFVER